MLKKLLFTCALVATVFTVGMSYSPTPALAQDSDLKSEYFMFELDTITPPGMRSQEKTGWINKGFNFIFERFITILAATVGSAAVLMMSVGGFMMLASAGRQDMYDKGKSYIFKSVIGLAFVLGAYILVTTVQLIIKNIYG